MSNKINLTIPFTIWAVFWGFIAAGSTNWYLLWVAALPWLFFFFFFFIGCLTLFTMYMKGYPITLTTPRKGTRVVRRGR